MIQWCGYLFVFVACTWIGIESTKRIHKRAQQLRIFLRALQQLENEIHYGHAPLHAAAERIAYTTSGPIRNLFELFSLNLLEKEMLLQEAWKNAITHVRRELVLLDSDIEIVENLSEALGRLGRDSQSKQIQRIITQLEREENHASQQARQFGHVFIYSGVFIGIMVVILLL